MSDYMNLQDYENKKQQAVSSIQSVVEIAKELKVQGVQHYLSETIQQLEKEAFTLTVVGEFSRGKSMFINALLGKSVLPSKVKPTTAMINRIYYKEEPSFSLAFRDPKKPIKLLDEASFRKLSAPREPDKDDVEDLQRYQTELNYFKQISIAEIGYPNNFCQVGVEIYDTPGTNDIDEAREEVTYSFVPKSDAVVFLLSATTPFGASEMEFLKERILSEHINKVFFVVNFKDRLMKPEDEQKVMTYIREKLQDLLPNPRMYLVSSMDALTIRRHAQGEQFRVKSQRYQTLPETGIVELESDLAHFFQYEKGQAKLEKTMRRLRNQIDELLTQTIALRLSASNMEIEEINQKIEELSPQVAQFKNHAQGIIQSLLDDLHGEEETLVREVETQLRMMIESMVQSLDHYTGSLEEAEIKRYLNQQSSKYQNEIQSKLNEVKSKIIEEYVTKAFRSLNTKEQELNKAVQEAFHLEFEMNHQFDVSLYQNDRDLLGMVIGAAGLGLSALIIAPALIVVGGIGAAIGAFFFGNSIVDTFNDYRRTEKINEIKKQVKQSLYDSRSTITGKFRTEWRSIIQKVEVSFGGEVNDKTLKLQADLHQIRMDKEVEKRSIEEQKRYYETLSARLLDIREQGTNLIK